MLIVECEGTPYQVRLFAKIARMLFLTALDWVCAWFQGEDSGPWIQGLLRRTIPEELPANVAAGAWACGEIRGTGESSMAGLS